LQFFDFFDQYSNRRIIKKSLEYPKPFALDYVGEVEICHFSIFVNVISPVSVADINIEVKTEKQHAVSFVDCGLLFALVKVFKFLLILF